MIKTFPKKSAKALLIAMVFYLINNFFISGLNLFDYKEVLAADDSITINSVDLTLQDDADGNSYANIGDTIRVEANISNGDNVTNTDCTTAVPIATVDLQAYGGTSAESLLVTACESGVKDIWQLDFEIVDAVVNGIDVGADNATSAVTLTASDGDESGGDPTANSNNLGDGTIDTTATNGVDTIAPSVTAGNISSTGTPSGNGSTTYIIGDTVIAEWDDTASGDNNSDTISSVSFDFSEYGGGAVVGAEDDGIGNDCNGDSLVDSGLWCASYTIGEGTDENIAANSDVIVVDDAGNSKSTSNTDNDTVDNQRPTGTASVDTLMINNSDLVQEVTITYDEPMAGGSAPTINFSGASGTFTSQSNGAWSTTTTWTESFIHDGTDEETSGINVSSSGATDAAGNTESGAVADSFDIDTVDPIITSITSDATGAGVLKVGDTITFTLTPGKTEAGAGIVGNYNGANPVLNWSTGDSGATYTATYTVAEGESDQGTALQISSVVLTDVAGNTSSASSGSDIVKTIDANSPTITSTIPTPLTGVSKIGDTITIDLTAGGAETGLTIGGGGCTVNGVDVVVNFNEGGGGAYDLSYTVSEGDTDRAEDALPINCQLKDTAGNIVTVSAFSGGPDTPGVDGTRPTFISATTTSNTNVQITMSEPLGSVTFGTATEWTAVAANMTASSVAINGDSTKLDLTVDDLQNTAFTANDFAFVVANGSDIQDAAGNSAVAFSGETIDDGQGPAFVSAIATSDTNIQITMSETIDAVSFDAGDWGGTGITATGLAINADPTKLDLTVSSLGDTAFTAPNFSFTPSTGYIRDAIPNAVVAFSSKTIADGQAPTFSAVYSDSDGEGNIDQVTLNFSEIVTFAMAPADWVFSTPGDMSLAGDFLNADCSGSSTATITCVDADNSDMTSDPNETGANGTEPIWTYTNNNNIYDTANNDLVSGGFTLVDGAAPLVLSRVTKDTNNADGSAGTADGQLDGVLVTFTEIMDKNSVIASDFEITKNDGTALTEAYSDNTSDTTLFFGCSDCTADDTADLLKLQITGAVADVAGNNIVAEGVAVAATDGAAPRFVSSALNYATGEMSIVFSEAIDATPGTNVDLTKIHVNDATGTNSPLTDLTASGPAVITEADSSTLSFTLTGTQVTALRATSNVSGGDGDANVLDLEATAVRDLNGLTNETDANHLDLAIVESSDATLTGASVTLSNSTVNQITNFTIAFTNVNAIPADGKIQIVFPNQFNILSADNQVATNLVGIDGTLTASVSGLTMTLTRSGGGTVVQNGTNISFKIAGGLNGSTAGATDTFIFRTQDSSDVTLDEKTDVAGVILAAVVAPVTTTTTSSSGGGGGGGGGGYIRSIPTDSNTQTSTVSSTFSSMATSEKTYTRPVQISSNLITNDAIERIKTVELTDEMGTITIQPNKQSTLWVKIPENTTLSADVDWDGKIEPPLFYSKTKVSSLGGNIVDSTSKLYRENVLQVVKVGSSKSTLHFSNKVIVQVPMENGEEGDVVRVYSSPYGREWTFVGEGEIKDGKINFETDHFSYFAIESSDNLHASAPLSRFVDKMFGDTAGHWAESYINNIASRGIVNGKSEGIFAPNNLITRAEMTKVAMNAFGFDVPTSVDLAPFTDVNMDAWYAAYVKTAKENGIVQGIGSEFKPNDPVTRAAALKILIEAAGFADVFENYNTNYASKDGWWYVGFEDALIGEWYARYVAYAYDNGIVGGYGDGTFKPGNPVTRAEVAKMVIKVLELLGE